MEWAACSRLVSKNWRNSLPRRCGCGMSPVINERRGWFNATERENEERAAKAVRENIFFLFRGAIVSNRHNKFQLKK